MITAPTKQTEDAIKEMLRASYNLDATSFTLYHGDQHKLAADAHQLRSVFLGTINYDPAWLARYPLDFTISWRNIVLYFRGAPVLYLHHPRAHEGYPVSLQDVLFDEIRVLSEELEQATPDPTQYEYMSLHDAFKEVRDTVGHDYYHPFISFTGCKIQANW